MSGEPKVISLSVRDFALPVPRTGSIDALSGYGRQPLEAQEIHQRVQALRAKQDSTYESEVSLTRDFERDGYVFRVGGRMDGIFRATGGEATPRIEEIKTSFSVGELARVLEESPTHPYSLQLRTYGYIHLKEHGVEPDLTFHLVSTRNQATHDLAIDLDVDDYEKWLDRRLDELVDEAKKAEKRAERRRKIAAEFAFPFAAPRTGQVELIRAIEEGMAERKRMLVQAPTGLGKTVGVLYPSLRESLTRGQRVLYVTPKNSQHSVAEDAVERFQQTGSKVKSLTITAKAKICFKAEPLCNPSYCEYAKDHYTKVHENKLHDVVARKKKLDAKVFRRLGEEHQVCPFELQMDSAQEADVVICDYNYVFAPRGAMGRLSESGIAQEGKPNLVVDEAHNLPSRAMDYYSPAVSSVALDRLRESVRELPKRFSKEAELLLDECIETVLGCKPSGGESSRHRGASKIDPPVHAFQEMDEKLRGFLSRYLESDVEIKPKDPVLRMCFSWGEFTDALQYVTDPGRDEFFTTYQPHPSGGTVKITCCDASEMLEACYDEYDQVVAFSATLKPFEYYAKLSGLEPDELRTEEFRSPFPKSNRKLLIIPQISTKYSDRERNYPKIAETIRRVAAVRPGNYFVFFPSFDFLERVLNQLDPPEGFTVLRQEREMRAPEIEEVLERLKSGEGPTLVFAVQGGVFSEGVDYPGESVIGAFIVGPPLPSFDLERETMREFYQKEYGAGFDYAYAYPAMAKAVQAAGRVIRSETDRGLIVLMDQRFTQPSYSRSMPEGWFEQSPRELVSSAILREVAEFWSDATAPSRP